MRVLVTGAGGMVGRAVAQHCRAEGDVVSAPLRAELDITDATAVETICEREQTEVIINCAAWTDVDGCQLDQERAYAVHANGPQILAAAARRVGASLVTISTDYVFDGAKEGFYTQRDDPEPESIYGQAKLAGERRAQAASARTTVVRTGWVYGAGGRNFLSTLFERSQRGESIRAIDDAYGTPTYAIDLARRLRELAEIDLPGVYHVTNSGEGTSYAGFALAALTFAGREGTGIEHVSFDSLQRPAPRPRNSRLRCLLSTALGLEPLPYWLDSLRDFAAAQKRLANA